MVCDIDFHRSNRIMMISRSLPFSLSAFLNIIVKLTYRYHYNIQHVHNFYFKLRGNSCQWGLTPIPAHHHAQTLAHLLLKRHARVVFLGNLQYYCCGYDSILMQIKLIFTRTVVHLASF